MTPIAQATPALPAMMPNTAVWFVLLGTSALLLGSRNISWRCLCLAKALVVVVVWHAGSTLAEHLLSLDLAVHEILIPSGYVYGATSLYASMAVPRTGMAPHTTDAALLLSAGVRCLRPELRDD